MSFEIRIEGTDVTFVAEAGQTVLDAAAKQGIEMPYSCRKGACGNCKGRVLHGELVPGTGGGGHEAGIELPDEHLFCRAQPASDLLIAPHSWRRVDPNARKMFTATVLRNQLAASDVSVLHLRFPAGVRARFAAGQYLEVLAPDGRRRAFSMANAPHESDGVQLHIRHMPGGGFTSSVVPGLVKGDVLQIELPFGDFYLREDSDRPLLFIAGGTGFAPIKSIIDHVIKRNIERPMTFFWGARDPAGLYAPEVVQKWLRQRPSLRYEPVISDPVDAVVWSGRRGLVHQAVLDAMDSVQDFDVYVCGAPVMVQAVRAALVGQRGLPSTQLFSDSFVVDSPAATA
ncbi:MAG: 2Fe-2S iron-sulfur cluster-binding protein [Hydrogenophaga sp.]|uniref:2Fe-2S iron-sulfur cluster-binding protein n=1 Tax=Ottowia sp. TaxID=1898956 RepID=UPI00260CC5B6|nr:2Fe-2S iron-sulfur cluster-binding protein [Ottowia sp.]